MDIAIFGAQGYALGAYEALTTLYKKRKVRCFMVSKSGSNPKTLAGLLVLEISELSSQLSSAEKDELEVFIATPESVQSEIEDVLESYGFIHHQRLSSVRWNDLMTLYHTRTGDLQPLSTLPIGCHEPFIRLYAACHEKDTPLTEDYKKCEYVIPIQAGAGMADRKVCAVRDDSGENITDRNGNYSELTALYWIWKQKLELPGGQQAFSQDSTREYYGLMQYRRVFDLSGDDLLRLVDNEVDAVLPYPLPYEPDINAHHKRWLKDADWEALETALTELQPEYGAYFPAVLTQRYLYNYNMILAKKSVLRDYCRWLFPILMRVEELSEPQGRDRADRYIGYMAETLETLYFMKNRDRLNIVHTGCYLLK